MSGRKKKSALLTADFGIRQYYDHLLKTQPDIWKLFVDEPIEVFCFRGPKNQDKDALEMTTYFSNNFVRTQVPIDEMLKESKAGMDISYRRTG
jgi:hypothetical protein